MDEYRIPENIRNIHSSCINNACRLDDSKQAGCFQCQKTFKPEKIQKLCDGGRTCLCPECGIDSVLLSPNADGIKPSLLQVMRSYYFRDDRERCSIDSHGKRQKEILT